VTVLVVGASSFIGRTLRAMPGTSSWLFLDWQAALASDYDFAGVTCVINCAFDVSLKHAPYTPSRDVDVQLAKRVSEYPQVDYLMLSSRMVYGPAGANARLHEALPLNPVSRYGIAKWHSEQALQQLLGERLIVLRLSNICGYELQAGRQSFFAIASRCLVEHGRIVLDMSPFVERDFLPVETLVHWLIQIVDRRQPGVFNLGAGQAVATGRIAQWLIEGFGSGELLVNNLREHDPFWLDIQAARQAFAIPGVEPADLREYCRALGRRLYLEKEARP
jgi:UDP-glucose 4-epimerase